MAREKQSHPGPLAATEIDRTLRDARDEIIRLRNGAVSGRETAQFNAAVMNWISEATSMWLDACRSDGGRRIMSDACMACWDAYNKKPVPSTHHWGQPPDRSGESERRDYTHPDTKGRAQGGPAHHTPSEDEIDALEFVVVNGHTASVYDYGLLRQWLVRLRPEFDSAKPIADGPQSHEKDTENRDFYDTKSTPDSHATPGEGTSQGEGMEPLYRSPALTDAEREAVEWAIFEYGATQPDHGMAAQRADTLRGLLERTDGAQHRRRNLVSGKYQKCGI